MSRRRSLNCAGPRPSPGSRAGRGCNWCGKGDPDWRKSWFYYYNYEKQFPYTPNVRSVRTAAWKYIHYPHGDNGPDRHKAELYHLALDPAESINLIDDPRYSETLQGLKSELARLMLAAGLDPARDPMPLDEGIKQKLPDAAIR
jgi:arylsulfatase A-like enzyme